MVAEMVHRDLPPPPTSPRRRPRLYAHRGASAVLPENTMAAFRRALHDGANALELDVHRTSDGHFVVCHDADGIRTAGVAEEVHRSPLRRVLEWDVGARFTALGGDRDLIGEGHRIPTLEEVLTDLPPVPISVDLKPTRPDFVPDLVELIVRHHAEDRVTLASFDRGVLGAIRGLGYPGRTALGRQEVGALLLLPAALARHQVRGQAAQVPLRAGPLRLDGRGFIRRCRRLGLRCDFWVVNDIDTAQALLQRGATGLMTDDPARLAPFLTSLPGWQPRPEEL
jgi:glycerophosphoryl diester phosphodiesterase